jgi:hypothetical protein
VLTRNDRQEALCKAYVRAVSAQAGVICTEVEQDYGVDLCLREVRNRAGRPRDASAQIDLQLKSTVRASVRGTEVVYDLEVKTYDDLREGGNNCPCFLVLLVLPNEEEEWLTQSPEQLVLRRCACWHSLRGLEAATATTTVRITIPSANVFSVEAIRGLLARVRERKGSHEVP